MKKVKGKKLEGPMMDDEKEVREMPRVTFTVDDLPEIKDWEVGEKYYIKLEVEQTAKREGSEWDTGDKKKPLEATFKVVGVKALDKEKVEEIKDEKGKKKDSESMMKEMMDSKYKNPNRL